MSRLGHAARALLWLVAALVCAMVASVLGMTALIVSLWDGRPVVALVAAGIGFADSGGGVRLVAARDCMRSVPRQRLLPERPPRCRRPRRKGWPRHPTNPARRLPPTDLDWWHC